MATKLLPMIPRKYIKPGALVDVWDLAIEGGPVKLEMTAILAREAMARDVERYKIELPRGTKPGPAQAEAEARAAEDSDEEAPDPVYGNRSQQ